MELNLGFYVIIGLGVVLLIGFILCFNLRLLSNFYTRTLILEYKKPFEKDYTNYITLYTWNINDQN